MSLQVSHLLKVYGTQKAVNDVSFEIGKGQIVGFLGPNGAGKSTTMKMITGYLQPDGGKAMVCGMDAAVNPMDVKKKIGYLPEANPLYYDMYIKEYLQFVAGVHGLKDKKAEVNRVITLTGLTPESKKKIGQLSKGYKQRVGLAAALVHNPEVLILDEPTSGLDPNQIVEIRNVIKEQGKDKTVLFSSHILQEVQAICDRVIIINKGQLVADDTLHNLQQGSSNAVQVTFKESVPVETLKHMPTVLQANPINEYSWQLTTNNTTETRRALLELALQNNLNIVSLQTAGSNLEEVFKSLTGNPAT
jgi:ABC-2 type transport system ATP-binding protein